MSGSDTVYPPLLSPVIEVFIRALILAEDENAPEIGVDHLLAALDSPRSDSKPAEQAIGPFVPTPHREKAFSSAAKTAIEAAGAVVPSDLEQLTIDSLQRALLATKREDAK